jgi:hypothetical protein
VYIFLIQITLRKKLNNEAYICSGKTSLSMHLDKLVQAQAKYDLIEGAPGSNLCWALSSFSLVSPHTYERVSQTMPQLFPSPSLPLIPMTDHHPTLKH